MKYILPWLCYTHIPNPGSGLGIISIVLALKLKNRDPERVGISWVIQGSQSESKSWKDSSIHALWALQLWNYTEADTLLIKNLKNQISIQSTNWWNDEWPSFHWRGLWVVLAPPGLLFIQQGDFVHLPLSVVRQEEKESQRVGGCRSVVQHACPACVQPPA
jgi:hypothetical protein